MTYSFQMNQDEYWWGGKTVDGVFAPYDQSTKLIVDFMPGLSNQSMPMFLSSQGRCIWSEYPFVATIEGGVFQIEGEDVTIESFGSTLKEAYIGAMNKYFAPQGNKLPDDFFTVPQYNTWMQMTYHQTQEGVLSYARSIVENGFRPGVLMIDEGWQIEYGNWQFDKLKFPDAKAMVDELHQMGFKVMLWVVPFVRPDGLFFTQHVDPALCPEFYDKYFLRTEEGQVALMHWWNGYSAILDFTKQCDCDFLDRQLKALMQDVGIDGFKFDGGCLGTYNHCNVVAGTVPGGKRAAERNIAWNDFGAKYAYHEYKDTFKGGGKRTIQRIRDRNHSWDGDGLNTLIPNALAQGLDGHPFICPDMIGGGEWTVRELGLPVDQELFVRMAQCSALFTMMQFSWAPWEAVDAEHLALIKAAHDLHLTFAPIIKGLVDKAHMDGQPIMRTLEYNYPHCGYEKINDIFMLGEDYLVAPVLVKGQIKKDIPLPAGKWLAWNGKEYQGGQTVTLDVTLADLPYFQKL